MKRSKINNLYLGLALGIVIPVLSFIIIWKFGYKGALKEYYHSFKELNKFSSLVSLSGLPNLLLFFLFIWKDYMKGARGVLIATFILAALVVLLKIF